MANMKEIQERMKSIRDTMKITNAMYMISSSKLKKAKKNLEDTLQRILIVEDNDDLRNYLVDILKTSYNIQACPNGKDALITFCSSPYFLSEQVF